MAQETLYSLVENEKVIFELNIKDASRDDKKEAIASAAGFIKSLFAPKDDGTHGVFVVTNMRCFVALQKKIGLWWFFCFSHEERVFWTFPLKALNGYNGYSSTQNKLCCCCKTADFTIDVGMYYGTDKFTLTVNTDDIKNHEQAQAIVAKLVELAQKSND